MTESPFAPPASPLSATWENVAQWFAGDEVTDRVLPALLRGSRWFGGKAHTLRSVRMTDLLALGSASAGRIALVEATYENRAAEVYILPLQLAVQEPKGATVYAHFRDGVLFDGLSDAPFRAALFEIVRCESIVAAGSGKLAGICGEPLHGAGSEAALALDSRVLAAQQSNSSIVYGSRFFLKLYRRPEAGVNPDAELIRFLTERQHFPHVPAFCGAIEYRAADSSARTLGLLVAHVPDANDAWEYTLDSLANFFRRVLTDPSRTSAFAELAADFLDRARQLGERTAGLHLALAADTNYPEFSPEPFTKTDLQALCDKTRAATQETLRLLREKVPALPPSDRADASALVERESEILRRLSELADSDITATKTRHHGDYHLGQVLNVGTDFVIIDFEGEPARSLAERRMKRSPLRDVAGMLRSFHYAAHTALGHVENSNANEAPRLAAAADEWVQAVSSEFTTAYLATANAASFIPKDPAALQLLLDVHLIEKAVYEVGYELNHRPAWTLIPVRGIAQILDGR